MPSRPTLLAALAGAVTVATAAVAYGVRWFETGIDTVAGDDDKPIGFWLGDYEECHCIDRASWPEPYPGTGLKPTEALKPLWGETP